MQVKLTITMLSLTALILTACGNKAIKGEKDTVDNARMVASFDEFTDSAPVNFVSVELDGDLLNLKFTYSGGCEKHEFALLGLEAMGKSLPPFRNIRLYHNNNGDSCRELITDSLTCNIKPLGYARGKEIKLMLEGWSEPIMYTMSK